MNLVSESDQPPLNNPGLFGTTLAEVGIASIGFSTALLAARTLGPVARGELAAIQVWGNALAIVAMFGLPQALVFFGARYRKDAGTFLASAVVAGLSAAAPLVFLGYVGMPFVLDHQGSDVIESARFYLWTVPALACLGPMIYVLRGVGHLRVWNLFRTTPYLLWLVILSIASRSAVPNAGPLARQYVLGLLFLIGPGLYLTHRLVRPPFLIKAASLTSLVRYGSIVTLGNLPQMLKLRIDQILMAQLLPPIDLGLYVVAAGWSNAVYPIFNAVGGLLFPRVAAEHDRDKQEALFSKGIRLGVCLVLVIPTLLLIITPTLIPWLFGRGFTRAVLPAMILLIASGFAALNVVLEEGLRGLGRPKAVMWAEWIALVGTGLMLVLLLPSLKGVGASLSSLFGSAAGFIVLISLSLVETSLSWRTLLVPKRGDLASIVAQTPHFVRRLLGARGH